MTLAKPFSGVEETLGDVLDVRVSLPLRDSPVFLSFLLLLPVILPVELLVLRDICTEGGKCMYIYGFILISNTSTGYR